MSATSSAEPEEKVPATVWQLIQERYRRDSATDSPPPPEHSVPQKWLESKNPKKINSSQHHAAAATNHITPSPGEASALTTTGDDFSLCTTLSCDPSSDSGAFSYP
eukprot:scaffold4438_cov121-Skeletonema_dohrnii-CCMP3373.AAC.1